VLKDKIIVIAGGAGLLGKAFSAAVTAHGGIAVIADRSAEAAEAVRAALPRTEGGAGPIAASLDITAPASLDALIGNLDHRFGRVDGLVNAAYPRNANYGREFFEVDYADFCENIDSNLGGYFLSSQKFAKYMQRKGGGSIVNISSIYGVIAPRFEIYKGTAMTLPVEYAAIKAGLLHLTRYMANLLKKDGVRINAISPGGIADGQPISFLENYRNHCGTKGMLDPVDICGALAFLLSDSSRYITGQNIIVDDGFTL